MAKVERIRGNQHPVGQKDRKLRVCAYCRVSTDTEDQQKSYESQVGFYKKYIESHEDWEFVEVYADKAVTGTKADIRKGFQRMIADALAGNFDRVLCKSISRFARNTVDTLQYVRLLKNNGIEVIFEEENINTSSMEGELLLTILSSVAQQEVSNISEHVKAGLHHKMLNGEVVFGNGILGYDYDDKTKTLSINEEEAAIVRYIFKRYIEGAGGYTIARELREKGAKRKKGSGGWDSSQVLRTVSNEKYCGDLLQGKSYSLDPINKVRVVNKGEKDLYYTKDHHEPIITREEFDKAQEILKRRSRRYSFNGEKKTEKYSRKYLLSSITFCGFCGSTMTRSNWRSGGGSTRAVWVCSRITRFGKEACLESKRIPEEVIFRAFVLSFNNLVDKCKPDIDVFIDKVNKAISSSVDSKEEKRLRGLVDKYEKQIEGLLDLFLENKLTKEDFDKKYNDLKAKHEYVCGCLSNIEKEKSLISEKTTQLEMLKSVLRQEGHLDYFDGKLFKSIVEKVVIGEKDDKGNVDPYKIIFYYKFGMNNKVDGKPLRTDNRFKKTKQTNSSNNKGAIPSKRGKVACQRNR